MIPPSSTITRPQQPYEPTIELSSDGGSAPSTPMSINEEELLLEETDDFGDNHENKQ